jgi:uncharacterized DUF497 family protein
MFDVTFEWDENKNRINIKKHGISFEEAKTVFNDRDSVVLDDEEHSQDEDRFIILGVSKSANLLMVCHCIREEDIIRIITARKATKTEFKKYRRN